MIDNTIIYFFDSASNANREALEKLLRDTHDLAKYTRPCHPAMMMPIKDSSGNSIEGIAFAEERGIPAGMCWGDTCVRPIAEAVWELRGKGEKIDFFW